MTARAMTILAAIAAFALAAPALADQHGGKGKGHEKAHEKGHEKMHEAHERMEEAGGPRGEAMRERRDERKAIMEEAKGAAEPGTPRKGKKPWWRFWESDEEWAEE